MTPTNGVEPELRAQQTRDQLTTLPPVPPAPADSDRPACIVCGGSGVRCCEFGGDAGMSTTHTTEAQHGPVTFADHCWAIHEASKVTAAETYAAILRNRAAKAA